MASPIVGEARIPENWAYLHSRDAHYWMEWLNIDPVMLQADVKRCMEAKGIGYAAWCRIKLPREKACILARDVI